MSKMMSMMGYLLAPLANDSVYTLYRIICLVLLLLMLVCAVFAVVVILFQPGNSTGIDALGGSSETFFGTNKSKSFESKMKKWTVISLIALAVMAIIFFILQLDGIWGV